MPSSKQVDAKTPFPLLKPLPPPRQPNPTPNHASKQAQADGMQDPRARALRDDTRQKRRDGAAGTAHGADDAEGGDLGAAVEVAREDGHGAGVDGAEDEAEEGDEDGVAEGAQGGHAPDEELRDDGRQHEDEDGGKLAEEVRGVREGEAAERDAGPESCGGFGLAWMSGKPRRKGKKRLAYRP